MLSKNLESKRISFKTVQRCHVPVCLTLLALVCLACLVGGDNTPQQLNEAKSILKAAVIALLKQQAELL